MKTAWITDAVEDELRAALSAIDDADALRAAQLLRIGSTIDALRALDDQTWTYRRIADSLGLSANRLFRLHHACRPLARSRHYTAADGGPLIPLIVTAPPEAMLFVGTGDGRAVEALKVRAAGRPGGLVVAPSIGPGATDFGAVVAAAGDAVKPAGSRCSVALDHTTSAMQMDLVLEAYLAAAPTPAAVLIDHVKLPRERQHRELAGERGIPFVTVGGWS
jgi:hypothetical protein